MSLETNLRLISAAAAALLAACAGSSSTDSTDAGDDPAEDCQPFDDSVTGAATAYEEVATNTWEERAIDTASCPVLGTPTGTCAYSAQVIDFQDDEFKAVLEGTTVKVFVNNEILDLDVEGTPCNAAQDPMSSSVVCYEDVADASGNVSFPNLTCDQPFAVWAHKISAVASPTKPAIQFDQVSRAGAAAQEILTISQTTYNLVPGIVGFSPDPTLGIVAGQVRDCAERGVQNLTAHVAVDHLTEPPADFCGTSTIDRVGTFYFRDNFPTDDQSATSEDGLWAFANVPPGDVTVFAFSNEGGTKALVGSTQLVALPDTITISDVYYSP